jgi:hypothetical protein
MIQTCPLLLILSCLLTVPMTAGEPIVGYMADNGVISLNDEDGNLLEITPVAWGPKWAYCNLKNKGMDDRGLVLEPVQQQRPKRKQKDAPIPEALPIRLVLLARPAGPRRLEVVATFTASAEASLTQVALSVKAGGRFDGEDRCTVTADGVSEQRTVPFSQEPLGQAVGLLSFVSGDESGSVLSLAFGAPVQVGADNAARIILAEQSVAVGYSREVRFSIELPGDLTWYSSPKEVPFPDGWESWIPWDVKTMPEPGSALDLSGWSPEPAGSKGRVVRRGDQLVVGGVPIRFWGINVCYAACAPEKALAEQRARLYAAYGINAVRLHKFADGTGWAGIQSVESFAEFDPEGLDRMDYFVAQLKAKGIYVKLSPNFGVKLGPKDVAEVPYAAEFGALPVAGAPAKGKKKAARLATGGGAIFLASELQDLHLRQMRNLLTHRNPYTGLTYAEDPAILIVEMFNEDSALFYNTLKQMQTRPTLRKRAAESFTGWLAQRYGDEAGLLKAWGPTALNSFAAEKITGESFAARSIVPAGNPWFFDPDQLAGSQKAKAARLRDTMEFLRDMQNAFWKRCGEAIRATGYQGEMITSNWQAGRAFSHYYNLHSDFIGGGLIDRHNYFNKGSMLSRAGGGMLSAGTQQASGMPFMLSEWIHTFPNELGIEGPAIIGAYGMGLQGWDVSFMFQNSDEGGFSERLGETWNIMTPQSLGLFPAVARQVRRGDVKAATLTASRNVHIPSLHAGRLGFDDQAKQAGDVKEADSATIPARTLAVARCTVAFTERFEETKPFDLVPFQKDGALVSSTGELAWREGTEGCITINTAATKAVVGWAGGRTYQLGEIAITPKTPFAAIYVTAVGRDEDLRSAKRVLVTAIARARNTGMKISGGRMLTKGEAPILAEPVAAEIVINRPGTPTVHALDLCGRRVALLSVSAGRFVFDGAQTKTAYYEISWGE